MKLRIQRINVTRVTKRIILVVAALLTVNFTAPALAAEEPGQQATIEGCQKESQLKLLQDKIYCGEEETACIEYGSWLPWYLFPDLIRGCKDIFTTCNRLAEDAHEVRLANCSSKSRQVAPCGRFGEVSY
jgi:hypothetical protein